MFEPSYLLGYVVLLPLLGAVLTGLFGGVKELARFSHYPALIGAALAAVCAILVAGKIADAPEQAIQLSLGTWFQVEMGTSAKFSVPATLRADSLTGIMICVISFIGTWIVLFSTSYMKGETGYTRYFAVVSLFISSMLLLVTADNFLLMFAGWEGVGACSYLLVGFWYAKPAAASAARKAFLVTRLGDVGLIMGIFLFWYMGDRTTIVFNDLFATAEKMATTFPTMFPVACLLTLCGALGKSAQFPLYVWLPDAMEGPTPVSALIHAATMVTAGVYLLARCSALFILAPQIQILIAVLGGITAILAAFIALTQHDLKRVLAYSTVSQLGFMFLALGCSGAVSPTMAVLAAIFHLFTHAFFKAVLFLSAGSVMHSMHHVIDMRQFSGLRKVLPITHWTFLAGAAALAGLPLLSGFWSKDLILEAAHKAGESNAVYAGEYNLLYYGALLTAFMTAFYTFRAYFRTFWGAEKMPEGAHPHEPWAMKLPLLVLAVGALGIGAAVQPFNHLFSDYLAKSSAFSTLEGEPFHYHLDWTMMIISTVVAVAGVGLAWVMYVQAPAIPAKIAKSLKQLYFLSLNKMYVDELYQILLVRPLQMLAMLCLIVELILFDLVRLVANIPRYAGEVLRPLQNGLAQFYALTMVMGVVALLGYLILFAK